jgi:integrative and conjugative element protein (TIGR02256 family)
MAPLETGGVLLGYWVNETSLVVTAIIGPGPEAKHTSNNFLPDAEYHDKAIQEHFLASECRETYLGDWHTHPSGTAYMSSTDKKTLDRIANSEAAHAATPVMLILGESEDWYPKAWIRRRGRRWFEGRFDSVVFRID